MSYSVALRHQPMKFSKPPEQHYKIIFKSAGNSQINKTTNERSETQFCMLSSESKQWNKPPGRTRQNQLYTLYTDTVLKTWHVCISVTTGGDGNLSGGVTNFIWAIKTHPSKLTLKDDSASDRVPWKVKRSRVYRESDKCLSLSSTLIIMSPTKVH